MLNDSTTPEKGDKPTPIPCWDSWVSPDDVRNLEASRTEAVRLAPHQYLCGLTTALEEIAKLSRGLPRWAVLRRHGLYLAWSVVLDVAFNLVRRMKGSDDA